MENVKKTFDEVAREFDEIIQRLIPYYSQMLEALVCAIPFATDEAIKVIDLGCGTGSVARLVQDLHPNARITCVDLAENMLEMAKAKLGRDRDVVYQLGNFEDYEFRDRYNVAVSSLALHHLVTDDDKQVFYAKIYENLEPGGVFYNADVVLGSSDRLQQAYLNQWKAFMRRQVTEEEIENRWIPYYYEQDRPAILSSQLSWLKEIGFVEVDVIWKYYNFAVYGGRK
jgi:tRNA (cmo5U34)-methyltransferase